MIMPKTTTAILLAVLIFSVNPSVAQTGQPPSGEPAADAQPAVQEPADPIDLKPEIGAIDEAGSKVGERIEQFGARASDRVGDWINTRVILDISWLKLLFCLALVFVVVVVERMVRWVIQRRIETIPHVEGRIYWVRLILKAVMRPLSLYIWVYGICGALSPL